MPMRQLEMPIKPNPEMQNFQSEKSSFRRSIKIEIDDEYRDRI